MTVIPKNDIRPICAAALLIVLILGLAVIRATGPSDLMDNEQQRQDAYVMDVVQNHHWLIQIDPAGEIASKPPLFTWLGAISTLIFGSPEPYAVRLIALLSTAGTVLLLYWMARQFFSSRAALLAAIVYLASSPITRQIWMARMDALLPLTITCGVVMAWLAWQGKCSWIWFWLAAAAGTLTKGPIGLLCAAPMAAVFFDRHNPMPRARSRGHLTGIILLILIAAGWFLAACFIMGKGVYDKLIIEEFLNQAVRVNKGRFIGSRFYEPPFDFIARFLPWSLFACVALWRIFFPKRTFRGFEVITDRGAIKQDVTAPEEATSAPLIPASMPTEGDMQRRFERFLACWFLVGMLPFCLGTHQRADLIAPLYVPGAILAGRELARWLDRLRQNTFLALVCGIIVMGLGLFYVQYHLRPTQAMKQTQIVAGLAGQIRDRAGADFPLTHVDDPIAVNIDLNTMRPYYFGPTKFTTGVYDIALMETYDFDAAAKLLSGSDAVFLVLMDGPEFRRRIAASVPVYNLAHVSLAGSGDLCILSNKPELRYYDDMVMGIGPLKLQSHDLHWIHASATDFTFTGSGSLTVTNNSPTPQTIHITHGSAKETHVIQNEIWRVIYP